MAARDGITADLTIPRITVDYVSSDSVGNSFDSPYTLQDVKDTNDANGWGLVTKIGNVYIFEAALFIAGSDTFFKDSEFVLSFQGSIDDDYLFLVRSESNAQVQGEKASHFINGTATRVKFIRIYNDSNSIITSNFYLAEVSRNNHYDCYFIKGNYFDVYADTNLDNVQIIDYKTAFRIRGDPAGTNNVTIKRAESGIMTSGTNATINNLVVEDTTYDINLQGRGDDIINIVNSKIRTDNYAARSTFAGTEIVNVQSEFKISIENAANASIILYDQSNNEVLSDTLNASGVLETTITYVKIEVQNDGDEITKNTKTTYEPFTLKVEKLGYQDLVIPGIYATELQDDGSRKGTLSATQVSGEMKRIEVQGENLEHNLTEDTIEHNITEDKLEHNIIWD